MLAINFTIFSFNCSFIHAYRYFILCLQCCELLSRIERVELLFRLLTRVFVHRSGISSGKDDVGERDYGNSIGLFFFDYCCKSR